MPTASQDQAAITAAIQAAATIDATTLATFTTTNAPGFTTLQTNLTALAGQMADENRGNQVTQLASELTAVLNNYLALVAATTAAETAIPDA